MTINSTILGENQIKVCVCSSEWQELSLWAPAHSLHTITTQLYTQTVDWQVFLPLQIPTEMAPLPPPPHCRGTNH